MNKAIDIVEEIPAKVGKWYYNLGREFAYGDVEFDSNKWADSSKFLPKDFDLCYCKMKEKTLPGWFTGTSWDGLNIKPESKVLSWKLNYDN